MKSTPYKTFYINDSEFLAPKQTYQSHLGINFWKHLHIKDNEKYKIISTSYKIKMIFLIT